MKATRYILVLALLFLIADLYSVAGGQESILKSVKIRKSEADTATINRFISKGYQYLDKKKLNIEFVSLYIDSASAACTAAGIEFPSSLHLLMASRSFSIGDYTVSETEALKALEVAELNKEHEAAAKAMNFLGKYYLRTGFFNESLDFFSKAASYAQKFKLIGLEAIARDGEANVYRSVGDPASTYKALRRMINASQMDNDSIGLMAGYLQLGTAYCSKPRDFRRADSLLRECYNISIIRRDTFYTAFAAANLGWNYYVEQKYDSAILFYVTSLDYSIPGKEYASAANAYGNIGTIYRDLGKQKGAELNYKKSIEYARLAKDYYSLSWVHDDMTKMYLNFKDTARAFTSYVQFKNFSDSNLIMQNRQGMLDARVRFEADNHRKEVQLLSLRLKNQRLLIWGYSGILVVLIVIGWLIFRSTRLESEKKISEMNHKLSELTQVNLRQQMNPHFIFNTLNSIQYYMYQHDKLATNNYLTKFSSLIRKVLENSQHTSIPLSDELDALRLYLELESLRFKDKFDFEITIDDEIDPMLFKVPAMLIQPYVENAICHGIMPKAVKGFVKIELKMDKDQIRCIIEDNGIGREAALEIQRNKGQNHNSLGTQITASRLDLVNILYGTSLKTIYTDLKSETGEAVGTRIEIQIPIIT